MAGHANHLILGAAAIAAALGLMSLTVNRFIRRKLRLSLILIAAYVVAEVAMAFYGQALSAEAQTQAAAFARLALVAAFINAAVVLLVNPLRVDRVPDRFPIILQDAIVIALILLASTFLSQQLLTTSAVSAVVLGFALQDTLGNAFAGLAIQSERPFHVGQWVRVGEFEGRVAEVTWRATKLRTKAGNLVVLPNNLVAKEAITNYSEPAAPFRLEVDVGASYLVPPNHVKAAMMEAVGHVKRVLPAPTPEALLVSFDASAITYRMRFWIDDYAADEPVRDEVRTAIYYAFQRHGIEMPWPIQVHYTRDWKDPDPAAAAQEKERLLASVDLFSEMPPELRHQIALAAPAVMYGNGESVVRQGDEGQSMFVVMSGSVRVVLEPSREELARFDRGGYFGEMSLLTGAPRSATVLAAGDAVVVEIAADLFRRMATMYPEAIEKIGMAAMVRKAHLEQARTATAESVAVETTTLMSRMKKFLRLA